MKTKQKQQPGVPRSFSLYTRKCAKCGKDLSRRGYVASGHVLDLSGKRIIFAACKEHSQEARGLLDRQSGSDDPLWKIDHPGYLGEWDPGLGLMALVFYRTKLKHVKII